MTVHVSPADIVSSVVVRKLHAAAVALWSRVQVSMKKVGNPTVGNV